MSDDRNGIGPYRPGSPDPTLLTRQAAVDLEDRMRREIASLEKLVEQRFVEFEKLANALNTAHEVAITKSDSAVSREIEALKTLATANTNAMSDRMNALQRIVDRGEGSSEGSRGTRQERRSDVTTFIAVAGFVLSVITALIVVIVAIVALPHSPAIPVTVAAPPTVVK
jgi:hypothetical protein